MKLRRLFWLPAGVIALAVALSLRSDPPEGGSAHPAATDDTALVLQYDLSLDSRQIAPILAPQGGEAVEGRVALDAVLVFEVFPTDREDAERLVGMRLEQVRRASFRALGSDLLASEGGDAWKAESVLVLDRDGTLVGLRFPEEATPLSRLFAQFLAQHLWVAPPPSAERFTREERLPIGVATTVYVPEPTGRWSRERIRYDGIELVDTLADAVVRVESRGWVQWGKGNVVSAIQSVDAVRVEDARGNVHYHARDRIDLSLRAEERKMVRRPAVGPTLAVGAVVAEDASDRVLDQRIAGLTAERLLSDLETYRDAPSLPDHNRWFWRATGLLRKQPELCWKLAPLFADAGNLDARARILNLLVGAGTPQAQEVLRQLISSASRERYPGHELLLQRLSLVAAPTEETIRFAEALFRSGSPGERGADAFVLGAVAGNAFTSGDVERARAAASFLLDELAHADNPAQQSILLEALGNAGIPDALETIARFAISEHPEVRASAAEALRSVPGERSRELLLQLVRDTHPAPQAKALLSLHEKGVGRRDLESLEDLVLSGAVPEENVGTLLNVVAAGPVSPEAGRILRRLATWEISSPELAARIRAMALRYPL